jgi:hypothetical protein
VELALKIATIIELLIKRVAVYLVIPMWHECSTYCSLCARNSVLSGKLYFVKPL